MKPKKTDLNPSRNTKPGQGFIERGGGKPYDAALLDHLMENIPDAIYFKDLKSRFIGVSKALVLKHGLTHSSQILGKTDFDFFSKESAQRFYETEQEMIRTGRPVINEEEAEEWQDGTRTFALGTKMPLRDKTGKIIGTFGISRDITDRKRAEEEISRINQELREVNAMKDRMLSVIAHDLKNPFASILGLSNIMVEDFEDLTPAELRNFITTINDSSNHLYRLLEQLLTWLMARAGRVEMQLHTVNMHQLAVRVIKLFEQQAAAKEVILESTILADQTAFCDENMTETILRNLVGNAIKFSDKGGKVHIALTERLKVSTLTVADTGMGIPASRLEKLFQEDEIQSSRGTKQEKGTGFGLLICREFAEKQGGSIRVESVPGKGTRVEVTLRRKNG